jgi:hypothetical protein
LLQADVDDVCHEPGCGLPAKFIPAEAREEDGRCLICPEGHRHYSDVVNVPMSEIKDLYWVMVKWCSENSWDIAHLVDVEQRLRVTIRYPLPGGGSVERILTGALDVLFLDAKDERHAIVVDFKDTWGMPGPSDVSFEGYFQQRFYALLVMRTYRNIERVTLREFYVRFSESREVTIERDKLPEIEAEFAALAARFDRAYENENFPPTPGKHCNWCPRPAACPIPVFTRGDGRIIDQEHATKSAAQLLVAQTVVKQTHDAMRAYCEINGPVPVKSAKGESWFAFEEYERTSRPTEEQAARAQAQGIPVQSLYKTAKGTRFKLVNYKPQDRFAEDEQLLAQLEESVKQAQKRVA